MRTPFRILAFVAGLVVVLVLGLVLGRWVGPDADETTTASADGHAHDRGSDGEAGHETGHAAGHDDEPAAAPAGLMSAAGGHALRLRDTVLEPGRRELSFTIEGPDGPVTDYAVQHEKELHLIVVRRDLTGFQHVHPERRADGTWRTLLDLEPGTWRVLADFATPGGGPQVLGTDLFVPGGFQPAPPSGQQLAASVDGYDVNLGGAFTPGVESTLTATVSRDGEVVTDLEPYLGASGHLVALRAGDLAYLHVHPEGGAFHTSFPTAGTYRLFLDFKHRGAVRTAGFTVEVEEAGHDHGSHDHGSEDQRTDTDPGEEHPVQDPTEEPVEEDGHGHDH